MGVTRRLQNLDGVRTADPDHTRGDVEIDINGLVVMKVRADSVIGDDLRERAGAAVPLVWVIDLLPIVVVVRVIEAVTIRSDRLRAKNAVVEDALHAIAIAAVACGAQKVARNFEVGIRSARGFKAG